MILFLLDLLLRNVRNQKYQNQLEKSEQICLEELFISQTLFFLGVERKIRICKGDIFNDYEQGCFRKNKQDKSQ